MFGACICHYFLNMQYMRLQIKINKINYIYHPNYHPKKERGTKNGKRRQKSFFLILAAQPDRRWVLWDFGSLSSFSPIHIASVINLCRLSTSIVQLINFNSKLQSPNPLERKKKRMQLISSYLLTLLSAYLLTGARAFLPTLHARHSRVISLSLNCISTNREANFQYAFEEKFEAGIVLIGK